MVSHNNIPIEIEITPFPPSTTYRLNLLVERDPNSRRGGLRLDKGIGLAILSHYLKCGNEKARYMNKCVNQNNLV